MVGCAASHAAGPLHPRCACFLDTLVILNIAPACCSGDSESMLNDMGSVSRTDIAGLVFVTMKTDLSRLACRSHGQHCMQRVDNWYRSAQQGQVREGQLRDDGRILEEAEWRQGRRLRRQTALQHVQVAASQLEGCKLPCITTLWL